MPTGIIYLYSRGGEMLQYKSYDSRPCRKEIIRTWRSQYGFRFYQCFLQIVPHANEQSVHKLNGENIHKKEFKKSETELQK